MKTLTLRLKGDNNPLCRAVTDQITVVTTSPLADVVRAGGRHIAAVFFAPVYAEADARLESFHAPVPQPPAKRSANASLELSLLSVAITTLGRDGCHRSAALRTPLAANLEGVLSRVVHSTALMA
ncbi:jg17887 [Pararge aegeria aegeria]|uniref:Jg17887 protein n=1 Tax=Pararge aegeria aegeria TaxID=348720 RepID=A0A8S4SR40_9NEOP|nr:jg17887 [Pararge aegeria aegeria]